MPTYMKPVKIKVHSPRMTAGAWAVSICPSISYRNRTYNLGNIDRPNHDGLSDTESGDKPACIYGVKTAAIAHEDSNSQNPQEA